MRQWGESSLRRVDSDGLRRIPALARHSTARWIAIVESAPFVNAARNWRQRSWLGQDSAEGLVISEPDHGDLLQNLSLCRSNVVPERIPNDGPPERDLARRSLPGTDIPSHRRIQSYSSIIVAVSAPRAVAWGALLQTLGTPWANTRIHSSPEPPFGAHHVPGLLRALRSCENEGRVWPFDFRRGLQRRSSAWSTSMAKLRSTPFNRPSPEPTILAVNEDGEPQVRTAPGTSAVVAFKIHMMTKPAILAASRAGASECKSGEAGRATDHRHPLDDSPIARLHRDRPNRPRANHNHRAVRGQCNRTSKVATMLWKMQLFLMCFKRLDPRWCGGRGIQPYRVAEPSRRQRILSDGSNGNPPHPRRPRLLPGRDRAGRILVAGARTLEANGGLAGGEITTETYVVLYQRELLGGAGRNRNQGDGRNQRRRYEFWSSSTASQAQTHTNKPRSGGQGAAPAGWAATIVLETAGVARRTAKRARSSKRLNEQLIAR